MFNLEKQLIAKLDTTTFNFQKIIMDRLKLYEFARAAIRSYCIDRAGTFEGYDFKAFKSKFKLVQFKRNGEIKSIEYDKIIQVGNDFVENELADSVYVLNMGDFERWLLDILRIAYMKNPGELFQNEKQIDISLIKESFNLNDLWEKIIDKHLIGLPYDGMKKMLTKFLKVFDIRRAEITANIIDKINENSQCRHLIIHNHKIVNESYIEKSGKFARFNKDEKLNVSDQILFEEGDNLLRFMQDFRKYLEKKEKK